MSGDKGTGYLTVVLDSGEQGSHETYDIDFDDLQGLDADAEWIMVEMVGGWVMYRSEHVVRVCFEQARTDGDA